MNHDLTVDKETMNNWLKINIVPKIAMNLHEEYDNATWKVSVPENAFFLSSVVFMDLTFVKTQNSNGKINNNAPLHLVIKRPGILSSNPKLPGRALFHNEILFYKRISKFIKNSPRYFYAVEDQKHLENAVIVIENIGRKGFKICPQSYDIPFEYIISGMQTIGRFHANGYTMKNLQQKKFFEIVESIQETRYERGNPFGEFINLVAIRPIEWLEKQKYDQDFINQMKDYFNDAFVNIMIDAVKPIEPLAVLCHGDFTRNNIFFRKTNNGLEGMLFDFAMLRYASPSIDLATFLYLYCSNKERKERFNEIFKAYHDELIKNLQQEGLNNLNEYSYEKILADYKRRAIYGYVIALFFLPVIRGFVILEEQDIINFDPIKSGKRSKEGGGDALSAEFAEILLELRATGCLDHIIRKKN